MSDIINWVFPDRSILEAFNKFLEVTDLDVQFFEFCKVVEHSHSTELDYDKMNDLEFIIDDFSQLNFFDYSYSVEELIILEFEEKLIILSGVKTFLYFRENGIKLRTRWVNIEKFLS
ncbi:MAG TPA: hypothetical protein PLG90_03420 [Ignavibacteria bacterium]|nr:hypothetical protein [Ignavibacteria bacterium]